MNKGSASISDFCNEKSKKNGNTNINSLDYYHEIEEYQAKLSDSLVIIRRLETELLDTKENHKSEILKLNEDISKIKEKYDRLHDSHKRISRLNHDLEERTLTIIDQSNTEKADLELEHTELLSRYSLSQSHIIELEEESERYKTDCLVAVQLLQNNPAHFLPRNVDTLPINIKERLLELELDLCSSPPPNGIRPPQLDTNCSSSISSYIPIMTFPPTSAMTADMHRNRSAGDLTQRVDLHQLAQILNPHRSQRPLMTVVMTTKCSRCGSVVDYKDQACQTPAIFQVATPSFATTGAPRGRNFYQNQNCIFDV